MKRGLPTDVIFRNIRVAASERARKAMLARMYRRVRSGFGGLVKLGNSFFMTGIRGRRSLSGGYYRENGGNWHAQHELFDGRGADRLDS